MIKYKIYGSFEEIASAEDLFSSVALSHRVSNLFGSYFWMVTYAKMLATNELFIVAAYEDNALQALVPFQRNGPSLTSLCDHKTDYNTIFIGKEFDFSSCLDFLHTEGIHEIFLKNIVKEHDKYIPAYVQRQRVLCPVVYLREGYAVNERLEKEILWAKSKIGQIGKLGHQISLVTPDLTNTLLLLHTEWWNSKSQSGLFYAHKDKLFLNQVLLELGSRQHAFYSILFIGDEIASMLLLFELDENRIGYYFGGHSLKFKQLQIGHVHIETLLKHLANNSHYLSFDFLRGDELYKYNFGARNDNYVFNCRLLTNTELKLND